MDTEHSRQGAGVAIGKLSSKKSIWLTWGPRSTALAKHHGPQGSPEFLYLALDANGGAAMVNEIKFRGGSWRQQD
jgi:hypothetical protein